MDTPARPSSLPSPSSLPKLPKRRVRETLLQGAGLLAVLLVLAWAWRNAEIEPLKFVKYAANGPKFLSDFFPPDFTYWESYLSDILVTVAIAIWGTVLALIAAIPLALLATANITPWWVSHPVHSVLVLLRGINEIAFALLFVVVVGLGPFAGTLAVFVYTTGILGKLFAEAVEPIDPRPVEGIRAIGATVFEEIRYGVIPQVLPLWVSYTLYRFESNVRSATVLGIVGAGVIGMSLWESIRGFNYAQASAMMLMILVAVTLIDVLSATIRKATV